MPEASDGGGRDAAPQLAGALELARAGRAVFPCGPDKAPRTPRGFHDATTDEETIRGWDWAGALIGAEIPEGQVVLDVDPRNGGRETMKALKDAGHRLPRTFVVRTAGGGDHYYFVAPTGVELRGRLGRGVDVKRAGRGYVIAPPSEGYKVLRSDDPAELPEWLAEALVAHEKGGEAGEASDAKFMPWEKGTAYGLAALAAEVEALASAEAGGRNDALNRAAFSLAQLHAGGELDEEHAVGALTAAAADAGLTAAETKKTIDSGWRAGLAEPRQAPERERPPRAEAALVRAVEGDRFWLDWDVDEPEPEFLLWPIIPKNAYVLAYGPAAASKSMVFTALGAQASRHGVRTTLYSLENPPHIERHRLRRLRPDPEFFRATNEPLDLNDPAQFEAFVEREREWGTRLVIVDTYSHAFSSRSEDGNARAIEFARRMRFLMHETGCSVVLIDHTGYAHDDPRDASAKRQQVDVAVLMDQADPWQPGQPASFSMQNRKAARFGNPFDLEGKIRDTDDGGLELSWVGDEPEWRT